MSVAATSRKARAHGSAMRRTAQQASPIAPSETITWMPSAIEYDGPSWRALASTDTIMVV